jgi:hypothetical protein
MVGLIWGAGYPTGTNTRTGAGVGFVASGTLSSGCGFSRVIPNGCIPVAISNRKVDKG